MANVVALVLSFFIAGLGMLYLGDVTLGFGIILLWMMLCLIGLHSAGLISMIVSVAALLLWAYSFIETCHQSFLK